MLLTETNASVTLVRTEGRNEWMRILCSVTANTSKVTAFSGPKFWSSVENLPPLLENINTHELKWPRKKTKNNREDIRIWFYKLKSANLYLKYNLKADCISLFSVEWFLSNSKNHDALQLFSQFRLFRLCAQWLFMTWQLRELQNSSNYATIQRMYNLGSSGSNS